MPSPTEDLNEDAGEVKEVKRGRGRPRKTDKPQVEKKSSEPPAKRGRKPVATSEKKGAKAKKVQESESEPEEEDDDAISVNSGSTSGSASAPAPAPAPAKRGRGRPPGKSSKKTSKESKDEDDEARPEPAVPEKKGRGKKAEGRNGNTEDSEEDETAPTKESSEGGIKLIVEHCKSCHTYRDRAVDVVEALVAKWPKLEVEYHSKPRKGSFDFKLVRDDGSEVNLYSGVSLGPPRKLKFPDPSVVVEAMEDAYTPE